MASKSKRRRRVLGASCILAALIVAGSSFAWFTSKDEVTNRLTANSNYGVSIVESFVPPENWLPGQSINKDVYAVNTGNIAAFVKEDISGMLNYTYESIVEDFDPANCVELSENERVAIDGTTTHEAGGFLAWTNAKTTVNNVYKVGDDVYTLDTAEVSGYVGDADATFVTLKKAGSPDLYLVKAADGKYATGATVYSDVGTRAKAAVAESSAVAVDTPKLTVVAGETPTYKIGEDVYTLSTTPEGHSPGYYALTAEGKDTYYVASANPVDNADLYSDPGHNTEAAVVAENATDSGNTLTADTEGGEAAITPGSVNSARIKDAEAGDVTPTRWTPPASGDYIFRRSIDTSAAGTLDAVDNPDVVKYTYAGYHYDADSGKYYKIVIGNDAYPTMSLTGDGKYVYDISAESSSLGDVEIDKDGAITM